MKKLLFILIMLSFAVTVYAPGLLCGYVLLSVPINGFDPLIKAVVFVESSGGKHLYNADENAVGAFQIRQIRIDDYNRLTGSHYTLNDCYDFEVSKKVFLYFAKNKSYEMAARSWNGSGRKTEIYWKKIQVRL